MVVVCEQGSYVEHGFVVGMLRSVEKENPKVSGKVVGVEALRPSRLEELVAQVGAELASAGSAVRYVEGRREEQGVWEEAELRSGEGGVEIRAGGVYLVTGGGGGLGRIVTRQVRRTEGTRVILVGRRGGGGAVGRAGGAGGCTYEACDVTDGAAVRALVARVRATHGALTGVIHSAGVGGASLVAKKTAEEVARVLRVKVEGTRNVDEATRGEPLEVMVYFSSISAVLGDVGLADYASGNAYMDEYARYRNELVRHGRRQGRTVSINWGLWREGGMQVAAESEAYLAQQWGMYALPTAEGEAALEAVLGSGREQVMVVYGQDVTLGREEMEDAEEEIAAASASASSSAPEAGSEARSARDVANASGAASGVASTAKLPAAAERAAGATASGVASTAKLPAAAAGAASELEAAALRYLGELLARELKLPAGQRVEPDTAFEHYGIDSIRIIRLTNRLGEVFGKVSSTLLFEHQDLRQLARYFAQARAAKLRELTGLDRAAAPAPVAPASGAAVERPARPAPHATRFLTSASPAAAPPSSARSSTTSSPSARDGVAIIGLAGRYPQAPTLEVFWENLAAGRDCIQEVPAERWALEGFYDAEKGRPGRSYSKWGGFLEDVDRFDPLFFNISPREAEAMDPQERLFLLTVWQMLEDAGYTRQRLARAGAEDGGLGGRVGVYVGVMYEEYQLFGVEEHAKGNWVTPTGNASSIANRVSYYLNLHGPSMAVATMCSSSLTALHLACESLQSGSSAMAIAGGVNLSLHPSKYRMLSDLGLMSEKGRCESFGMGGEGYVPSEGVGALLLKPLAQAEADGDRIYGVIRATAVNHGGKVNGFTVPSPKAQAAVIRDALQRAGLRATDVSYLEAHGTGTSLGDPIEIAGLAAAFDTEERQFCRIGSVKSNLGHCEAAAGVSGVTKVLLQLQHGQLVPSLHSAELNPHIDFAQTPFVVQQRLERWEVPAGKPRIAGVSSFGAGGSNVHVIVEEYVARAEEERGAAGPQVVVLSARNGERLAERAQQLAAALEARPEVALADVAYTLQVGREAMEARLAMVAETVAEVAQRLRAYARGEEAGVHTGASRQGAEPALRLDGEAGRAYVAAAVRARELGALAQLWVSGGELDWARLHEGRPRLLALPTYPFARERYWLRRVEGAPGAATAGRLHPLLHENASTLRAQQFVSRFTGEEDVLADHQVRGVKVLPGAAYLELAREAGARSLEADVRALTNVRWLQPLAVTDAPRELRTHVALTDDGAAIFEVLADGDAEPALCCSGQLSTEAAPPPPPVSLAALRARLGHRKAKAECYELLRAKGLQYGRAFQGIEALCYGDGEALARLELPQREDGQVLPPAVLDCALQTCFGLVLADGSHQGELSLPFSVGEVQVHGALRYPLWSYARRSGGQGAGDKVLRCDVDLVDEEGAALVSLRDFVILPVARSAARASAQPEEDAARSAAWASRVAGARTHLYGCGWRAAEARGRRVRPAMTEVVLAGGSAALAQALSARLGVRVTQADTSGDEVSYFVSVQEVLQERLRDRAGGHVVVVCEQGSYVEHGFVVGMLRSVEKENPKVSGKVVGVEALRPSRLEELVAQVGAELASAGSAVRYVEGRREEQGVWEEAELRSGEGGVEIRAGGVYLVTGGGGGLGRIVTRQVRRTEGTRVILVGRRAAGAELLGELEALGGCTYEACDVTDGAAVRALVARVRATHGALTGVIHSAGVGGASLVAKKTAEEVARVLRVKVEGTRNVDEATRGEPLEVMVYFSSISAVLGDVGLADYASGNAYMDEYARYRNELVRHGRRQGRTVSINWGLWREGGMQVAAESEAYLAQQWGMYALPTAEGEAALEAVLGSGREQVMVVYGQDVTLGREEEMEDAASAAPEAGTEAASDAANASDAARGAASTAKLPARAASARGDTAATGAARAAGADHARDLSVARGSSDARELEEAALRYLGELLARELRLSASQRLEPDTAFEHYGIDSILIIKLTNRLGEVFGKVSSTLLFERQNLRQLARYFAQARAAKLRELTGLDRAAAPAAPAPASAGAATVRAARLEARGRRFATTPSTTSSPSPRDGVAIIGLAGRYPQAPTLEVFWENLAAGRDCIQEVPAERWALEGFYDAERGRLGRSYSKWGGFLEDVDRFDPLFFNISPREAETMDPQERLFLLTVWQVLEDAGYTRQRLARAGAEDGGLGGRVGVYVGVMYEEYQAFGVEERARGRWAAPTGNASSIANRVSYYLNLHGPSMAVATMCSSSLTALHLACESLWSGSSAMAIAGGVNLSLRPDKYLLLSAGGFVSSVGRCESFGVGGEGYVPSEGVGALLLKPLAQAEADGDRIYGVIRATAVNHGGKTNGYFVPNPVAQAAVIRDALQRAGLRATDVSYLEAHGTGTSLGDPIEIAGLAAAFDTEERQFCRIGSVKSNLGHCEAAAGVSGVTKVLLQLQHGQLVPSLHSAELNPHIDFAQTPFVVQQRLERWEVPAGKPRIAGVSSFGAGGSNVHVIVEEYVARAEEERGAAGPQVVVLSARNGERLAERAQQLAAALEARPEVALADVAYTLQVGREAMEARLAMVAETVAEVAQRLRAYARGEEAGVHTGASRQGAEPALRLDGEAGRAYVAAAVRARELGALAQLWVSGGELDWARLHEGRPRLLALPTYPFARERYWLPLGEGVAPPTDPVARLPQVARAASSSPPSGAAVSLLVPRWELLGGEPGGAPQGRYALWSLGAEPLAAALRAELERHGCAVSELAARRDLPGDARQLLICVGEEGGVGEDGGADEDPVELELFALLKMWQEVHAEAELSITFVTVRCQAALTGDVVQCRGAGVAGLVGSVAKERPRWRLQVIDAPASALSPSEAELLVRAAPASGRALALRAGRLLERRLCPWQAPPVEVSRLRRGGVYVLVGGAGGLGVSTTEHLLERYDAQVVWIGRSEPAAVEAQRARLAARGYAAPLYLSCDTTQWSQVEATWRTLKQQHPEIHGVFHAALVLRDAPLAHLSAEDFQQAFDAKARSGDNVLRACEGEPLDFFCFYSSVQALFNAPGQSNYSAGCTYADSLARRAASRAPFPVYALNWGYWSEVGAVTGEVYRQRMRALGIDGITAREGMETLEAILASDVRQVAAVKFLGAVPPALPGIDPARLLRTAAGRARLGPPRASAGEGAATRPGAKPELERLALGGLLQGLLRLGLGEVVAEGTPVARWPAALGVPARHHALLRELARNLEEAGQLGLGDPPTLAAHARAAATDLELTGALEEYAARHPELAAHARLLAACLPALPAVLRDERPATDVLFPGGDLRLVSALYTGNVQADRYNRILADALADSVAAAAPRLAEGAKLRILEVGAGTGGTSAVIFERLRDHARVLEYIYTDVSPSFLRHAEATYRTAAPYLQTSLLDLEAGTDELSHLVGSCDAVIAANVVHATRDIERSLAVMKALLKKGGVLLLNEIARPELFATLTFGMLDGWWRYEDAPLRVPGSPCVRPETWAALLEKSGFTHVTVSPGGDEDEQKILTACSDGLYERVAPRASASAAPPASAPKEGAGSTALLEALRALVAEAIKLPAERLAGGDAFADYGVDSIMGAELTKRINERFGVNLPGTAIFNHPTVAQLAAAIESAGPRQALPPAPASSPPASNGAPASSPPASNGAPASSPPASNGAPASSPPASGPAASGVAIVAYGGVFPGVDTPEELWARVAAAHCLTQLRQVDGGAWYGDIPDVYVAEDFEAVGIDRAGFERMGRLQRTMFRVVGQALGRSGLGRADLRARRTGVFACVKPGAPGHASARHLEEVLSPLAPNLLSFQLDLQGPSEVVNTFCTSTYAAMHRAIACITAGECEQAVVVAVNVLSAEELSQQARTDYTLFGAQRSTRSFSDDGAGFVRSEGAGALVLKPLALARADGQPVHAVVRGTAVGHGGKGFSAEAPSARGIKDVIARALRQAELRPDEIDYLEAHGTANRMADAIELGALDEAYAGCGAPGKRWSVGSVKPVIGHPELASGMASILKVLAAFQHGVVPAIPALGKVNSEVRLRSTIALPTEPSSWPRGERPRRAALNSFALGGNNAHVILEQGELGGAPFAAPGRDVETAVAPPAWLAWATPAQAAAIARLLRDNLQLELGELEPDRSLFDLGLGSLDLVRTIRRLNEELSADVRVGQALGAETVGAFFALVRDHLRPASEAAEARPAVRAPASGPFALTSMQQAYWVGEEDAFELGGKRAHSVFQVEQDRLDVPRLERALGAVIARHEMLRARFTEDGHQRILDEVPPYRVASAELRAASEPAWQEALAHSWDELVRRPPGRLEWPLFVIRHFAGPTSDVLQLSLSLLVFDGASISVFLQDLFGYYRDDAYAPAPLGATFRAYVAERGAREATRAHARARAYWTERVKTLPPGPELPLSLSQPAEVLSHSDAWVDAARWRQVIAKAQEARVSPAIAALCAYTLVLARWTRTPHFSVAMMSFGRDTSLPDVTRIVGNFSGISIVEIDLRQPGSLAERMRQLQQRVWDDLEHASYDGVEVLRELNARLGTVGKAVVPVTFASTFDLGFEQLPEVRALRSSLQVPQVVLDHQVYEERDGRLRLSFDVDEACFPPGLPAELLEAYAATVHALATHDWSRPLEVALPARQQEVLREAAREAPGWVISDELLFAPFDRQAVAAPERVALIQGETVVRYGELARRSARIAARLRAQGAAPNRCVAIVMRKGWEQVPAALGIMKAGAAYLPIDADMPAARRDLVLDKAQVTHVLTTREVLAEGLALPAGLPVYCLEDDFASGGDEPPPPVQRSTDLAYVIFTSGSTGTPKGVMIDHRGALNTCRDINDRYGVTAEDAVLALSALHFDLSVYDLFGVLGAGGRVVYPERSREKDPEHWIALVRQHGVTVWNSVPELMNMMVECNALLCQVELPLLRLAMLSGDWVPVTLPAKVRACAPHAEVVSLGGATEASIWSIAYDIHDVDPAWTSIPYGKALRGQRMFVLGAELEPTPLHVVGDIYIGGVGLAQGYLRDEERTALQFVRHPRTQERLYRTGDLGRTMEDGNIEFLGRDDFQVKLQGYRIELGEIEAALLRHPDVTAAVVDMKKDRSGRGYLVAYTVHARPVDDAGLEAHLAAHLQPYMVPRHYVRLERLPVTSNGKIDRSQLPEPLAERRAGEGGRAPAASAADADRLRALWREVLELDERRELDGRASFFALGGNSLLAIRLAAKIKATFGVRIEVSALLLAGELDDMLALLSAGRPRQEEAPRCHVALNVDGDRAPLVLIHPIGGSVFCYRGLATLLGPAQPVYAFRSQGLEGDGAPLTSVPAMAGRYLEELRKLTPRGPYRLGGWSFGGLVAFEMAQQLEAAGEQVRDLYLIDSYFHQAGFAVGGLSERDLFAYFLKDLAFQAGKGFSSSAATVEALLQEAVAAGLLVEGLGLEDLRRILAVFRANCEAYVAYRPTRPVAARVVQFVASDLSYIGSPEQAARWRAWTRGEHAQHVVEGNHFTMMAGESLQLLARHLRAPAPRDDDAPPLSNGPSHPSEVTKHAH
ncbi:MAG: amino acid adenylation domain-containing protein [Kofleriaceae bacterium]